MILLVFLALYVVTLLPDVLPADSGEFQRAAATAGVAHPPGYPLYTMAGWLFSQLPLGPTPAWRVNVFSAVAAAATVALVYSTAWTITGSSLSALTAALTLGSATTFWATATKASIRPLTAFFTALCLYALAQHSAQAQGAGGPKGDRYLVLFSLSLSLGVTHHPSLVFPGALFVLYLILIDPGLLSQTRRWLKPMVALLPGLLVLIYLPARGAPDLATASGFLDYVLARGFRGDMFALGLSDRLVLFPTLLRLQFNDALLMGMLLGALLLLLHDRKLAVLLIGSFLVHTIVTLTYDAPQTVEYEIPAYVSLALLIAVPFRHLSGLRSQILGPEPRAVAMSPVILATYRLVAAAFLLAAAVNLVVHLPSYRSLSRSHNARDYSETLLREAPEGAVILSNWHWFTPLRYLQEIEGARPDVAVEYVAPRGEPLAQTWVHAIDEWIAERSVIVVRMFEHEYAALPYSFEPLGEAFLVRIQPRAEVPSNMIPLEAVLGGQIEIGGYRLAGTEVRPGEPLTVILAWSPAGVSTTEVALFAQLIGPDGVLWSTAEDPRHPADTLSSGEVVVDRFVVYPRLHAPPGDYTLVVGAYSSEGRFKTADGSDVLALETVSLQASTTRPVTQHPRFVRFAGGPTLIGVDYDVSAEGRVRIYLHWAGPGESTQLQLTREGDTLVTTAYVPALDDAQYATIAVDPPELPSRLTAPNDGRPRRWNVFFRGPTRLPGPNAGERYVPFGDAMVLTKSRGPTGELEPDSEATLSLRFASQRPLERDYIVSTSLTGLNADGSWAWRASHDTVPALGAIPTLKWIRGSWVLDPHRMPVPDDAGPVPVVGSLLIYDHFTQRALPHLDERLEPAAKLDTWRVSH